MHMDYHGLQQIHWHSALTLMSPTFKALPQSSISTIRGPAHPHSAFFPTYVLKKSTFYCFKEICSSFFFFVCLFDFKLSVISTFEHWAEPIVLIMLYQYFTKRNNVSLYGLMIRFHCISVSLKKWNKWSLRHKAGGYIGYFLWKRLIRWTYLYNYFSSFPFPRICWQYDKYTTSQNLGHT